MMTLLIATRNRGKFFEIEEALKGFSFALRSLHDFPELPPAEESAGTFEGNALKKGRETAQATGLPVLADDSGLVVPALDGRPGIFSARYAGEGATDEANRQKLLKEMDGLSGEARKAFFVCMMALVIPQGPVISLPGGQGSVTPGRQEFLAEGRCDGLIATEPRGSGGFGYDPIFWIPSLGKTMAELPLSLKNQISHRGIALRQVREFLSLKVF